LDSADVDTPLVVIDHHEPGDLQEAATATCIDTQAPATAHLVADLLEASQYDLSPTGAAALAAGLLDDTGFRAVVTPQTQRRTLDLLRQAQSEEGVLADLWDPDPS
jgi:nanoRNase/pAp phosphatase (c-di-AMP/oligoRNAs hydrolase)